MTNILNTTHIILKEHDDNIYCEMNVKIFQNA